MQETTTQRHSLQYKSVENPVKSRRWVKHYPRLIDHFPAQKLLSVYLHLLGYSFNGQTFRRSMGFMAREFRVTRRTMQRYCDALEKIGILHRQEQRVSCRRNAHNIYTILTPEQIFEGVRLSSSGRTFVTGLSKETLTTKASTARARRGASLRSVENPVQKQPQKQVPMASRGMRHIRERKLHPHRDARFAELRRQAQQRDGWKRAEELRAHQMRLNARVGMRPEPETPLSAAELAKMQAFEQKWAQDREQEQRAQQEALEARERAFEQERRARIERENDPSVIEAALQRIAARMAMVVGRR